MTATDSEACTCDPGLSVDVGGVPIHPSTSAAMLRQLERALSCGASHVVNHAAADAIVQAWDNDALMEALRCAYLNLADGMAVVWASRLLGRPPVSERLYGPDFMTAVAGWGLARGVRHAFIGGADDAVLDGLVAGLRDRFPDLAVSGAYAPPIRAVTPANVADDIVQLQGTADGPADVLWVGLGTPKQQLWADQARSHRVAPAIFTVGAAFDFLSGKKRQAPAWMGRAGLEWAFRLAAEPRRLWRRYLLGNPRFAARILVQARNTRS